MAWVSFDEIKHAVSLEMVINHYRIELRRINETTLRGKCPLPMHGSDTSRASFTATLNKGVGGIWACQSHSCVAARDGKKGGNALDFVATMERCSVRDAAVKLHEWFRVNTDVAELHPHCDTSSDQSAEEEPISNKPLAFRLQNIDSSHPYLAERGISKETAETFGIGFFSGKGSMHNRIVIPIHNDRGELVAYAGRTVDGTEPKYKFPAGFQKSRELYNLSRAQSADGCHVILVEGFFDCMKLAAVRMPCIAIMGSALSRHQEELLVQYFTRVTLLLDGDSPGRLAARTIAEQLIRKLHVLIVDVPDGRQPDQLSAAELHALLAGNA